MSRSLLQRNTRYLLIWLPVILLACSLLFYLLMRMQAHHMQEEQLLLKQENIWNDFIAKSGNIDRHVTGEYDIVEGVNNPTIELNEPTDTLIYYSEKHKSLPFKILTNELTWNNKNYQISTLISSTEITHLIIKVFMAEAFLFIILLIAIVILNQKSSGLLWQHFFSTIKKVNEYDITRNQHLILPAETGTIEFDELNNVIKNLVNNVNAAYYNQKQFVENASHEMQTPLAIIRSKLELLIDQPNLTAKTASLLGDITDATNRLSQMNRTLLLLSKIENNQFPDTETVNATQMLKDIISDLRNYYEQFPEITFIANEDLNLHVNRTLFEILFSNLIKNAVEHNQPGGEIKLDLSSFHFVIENTGLPLQTKPEKLFDRFRKDSYQTKTTGLGLALVKQICNLYNYSVSYRYINGWHRIQIVFNQ